MAHSIRSSLGRAVLGRKRRKVSPAKRRANKLISEKIKVLRGEGVPPKQAIAMSISMEKAHRLRPGGVYVRANKKY